MIKFCKDATEVYDKIKAKRLELDSKKYRLEHAKSSDAAKLAHYEESVRFHSEQFEMLCNQFRKMLKPIFDDEKFQYLQTALVSSYLKALKSFYKRGLDKLEEFDRRENFMQKSDFDKNNIIRLATEGAEEAKNAALERSASKSSLNEGRSDSRASDKNNERINDKNNNDRFNDKNNNDRFNDKNSERFNDKNSERFNDKNNDRFNANNSNNSDKIPALSARPQLPPPVKAKPKETVVALYDFNPVEPGDLGFRKNDVIEVIKKDGDWWTGKINGNEGVFPSNYVQK
jgi:hypothetical protein